MPHDPELEQAVEKLLQKSEKPLAKAEQYQLMRKFSLRQRTGSETEQQAFVRFIERDPYGKQLYRQYTETRGVSVPTEAKAADSEPDESDHMRKLHEIADKIREKYPEQHLTKSAAITLAIQTPARRAGLFGRQADSWRRVTKTTGPCPLGARFAASPLDLLRWRRSSTPAERVLYTRGIKRSVLGGAC